MTLLTITTTTERPYPAIYSGNEFLRPCGDNLSRDIAQITKANSAIMMHRLEAADRAMEICNRLTTSRERLTERTRQARARVLGAVI